MLFGRAALGALILSAVALFAPLGSGDVSADRATTSHQPLSRVTNLFCNGHPIQLSGSVHTVVHEGRNGRVAHVTTHLSGYDTITGEPYRFNSAETDLTFFDKGFPQIATRVSTWTFIGHGDAPDFTVVNLVHLTLAESGPIVEVRLDRPVCRN